MRVLVLGSGAREHALLVGLAADASVTALACAPGNAGTAAVAENWPVAAVEAGEVVSVARGFAADLVVIGPEAPLVAGVAGAVREAGIACFGPSAAAARIEGSKAFAKDVMAAAGVPTAGSEVVDSPAELDAALARFGATWVVKDDGLAAGKGVVVTGEYDEARKHALTLLDTGHPVVLEEYLDGPEASVFCLVDGSEVRPLLPAQDSKRLGDGDTGPNTGGMGAYAPLPWAPDGLAEWVAEQVARPVVAELAARGTSYSGLLYTGLALGAGGPRVIEFNCRFGDPETQAILPLLQSPLGGLLYATATGQLAVHPPLAWLPGSAVAIVLAADGYPGPVHSGDVIGGAEGAAGGHSSPADAGGPVAGGSVAAGPDAGGPAAGGTVLHAGTARRDDGAVISAGGRVLTVVGRGAGLAAAREAAYCRLGGITLAGAHFRTDIALRAVRGEITAG